MTALTAFSLGTAFGSMLAFAWGVILEHLLGRRQ